jgi:hypothetical protein
MVEWEDKAMAQSIGAIIASFHTLLDGSGRDISREKGGSVPWIVVDTI